MYRKELELQDPLVKCLVDIGGEDEEYVEMLHHIENRTDFKNLHGGSELKRENLTVN